MMKHKVIYSCRDSGSIFKACQDYLNDLVENSIILKKNQTLFWENFSAGALQGACESVILESIAPLEDKNNRISYG